MKQTFLNIILPLIVLAAVVGGTVWLLPVKVSVGVLFVLQLATLVILGDLIKRNGHGKEE